MGKNTWFGSKKAKAIIYPVKEIFDLSFIFYRMEKITVAQLYEWLTVLQQYAEHKSATLVYGKRKGKNAIQDDI